MCVHMRWACQCVRTYHEVGVSVNVGVSVCAYIFNMYAHTDTPTS